jgi:AcrR family transcriptional regulator
VSVPDGTTTRRGRPGTRRRLAPSVRREQILDAAERVFADRDPSEVTLEEVADEAGVSRALVYNYFGDKRGLVAAVYFRTYDRLDTELARTLDAAGSAPDRLRAVVACYLRFASEHSGTWRLVGTAEVGSHPEVRRARQVRFERMALTWGGSPEAHIVARGLVGLLEAATLGWLEQDELDLDGAVDVIHRMVIEGLDGLDGVGGISLPQFGRGAVLPIS